MEGYKERRRAVKNKNDKRFKYNKKMNIKEGNKKKQEEGRDENNRRKRKMKIRRGGEG